MPRLITAGIVILYLMSLFYPSGAMAFTVANTAVQPGAPSKAATKSSSKAGSNIPAPALQGSKIPTPALQGSKIPTPALQRDVVNIVVDRIEGSLIYSKDWRTFEVPSSTKVIDNSHRVTKMRTAELIFENGSLVAVTLK
jgi:hypothetical protein